ncbi:ABC transporter permease [Microbulbifer aggregans]|uniref:ABC transporter permease n=1 Tax=Microbulbifer aggregans TaxID=1769779 RepID=UPI001CFDF3D7|nr:ABC transporter permease [Microbulbifer aggregans]
MNNGNKTLGWRLMVPLLRKELLEAWRDRRALLTAISFALLFPAMILGGTTFMLKKQSEEAARVALVGGDSAPLIQKYLPTTGIKMDALAEGDPQVLLAGDYDVVLVAAENFAERYQDFRAPRLYLYVDTSDTDAGRAQRMVQERLAQLQQMVAAQRLTARGVAPQVLAPWQLEVRDMSTPSSRGALILAMVPGVLIMTLFIASLATSVDTSAGERERLSLETLLVQPLPAWQVIVSKLLAVASIGWVGTLLTIGVLVALMPMMHLEEFGFQLATSLSGVIAMGLVLLPLALLVAVLQILLALRSQSFKDAQTQLSIFQIAPLVVVMAIDMAQIDLAGAWQLLPLVGHQQWLQGLLVGDSVSLPWMLAGSLVTLAVVAVSVIAGARSLSRETLLSAA